MGTPYHQDLRFGLDLVTFSHPRFWGVDRESAVADLARQAPRTFWDTLLDSVQAAGVTGIEMTFLPFHWEGAAAAYGSTQAFASQLLSRGLHLVGGYFAEVERSENLADPVTLDSICKRVEEYARFIADCQGSVLVAGMPMRKTPGQRPVQFFDLAAARNLSDFVNRLGAATAEFGVQLALHTEAHSVFAMPRDVDLLLLLTDPAYVHFCPDTAHLVMAGGNPLRVVERHRERMVIAHWKDATGPMPSNTPIDEHIYDRHRDYFCAFGAGCVDWLAWIRFLRDTNYQGWAILELDAAPDPVSEVSAGLRMIGSLLGEHFS